MAQLKAEQGVWCGERYFDAGTVFDVSEAADPTSKPPQVDATTAEQWKRIGWAKPVPLIVGGKLAGQDRDPA